MCRMLAYRGNDKDYLSKLATCLSKSAFKDPLSGDVHGDGWGIVGLSKDKLIHYRSAKPIFSEVDVLQSLIKSLDGEFRVIIHARLATEKKLVSQYLSHPYLETSPKLILFLAHNGSVNKNVIGDLLKIDTSLMVDSEVLAKYLIIQGIEKLNYLKDITESALNLFMLQIDRESKESHLYYYNFYKKDKIKRTEEYYKLYFYKNAVFSSSLAYTGCEKEGEVKFGELGEL
ncbi:MAG: class II glutamine amidotransferase [Saccharolobus sp.]